MRGSSASSEPDYKYLQSIDWTFAEAKTGDGTHRVHPYPAKFIPQIPRTLIEALHPHDGSAVLDPFCGSGTALVEAAAAGVPAVGIDINPLACLISKVKVTPLLESLTAAAEEVIASAQHNVSAPPPAIPSLDHWFPEDVQDVLTALVAAIEDVSDPTLSDALQVALSSIIVRVSRQESNTRYAAVEKNLVAEDVWGLFARAVEVTESALREAWGGGLFPPPRIIVLNRNVLEVGPSEIDTKVSLVITSPPYPNAYEYWLYHKYRMYWLGMDPISVRNQEIGARPHFFKKDPQTADDFEQQMGTVWALLQRVLLPGGHACFQVGDSIIRGELIDNAAIIRRAATRHGFRPVLRLKRQIPNSKKSFNPQHGRIRDEALLVFRLEER